MVMDARAFVGDLSALHSFVQSWWPKVAQNRLGCDSALGEGVDLDLQMLRQNLPFATRAIALVAEVCLRLPLGHQLEVYGEEAILSIDPPFGLGHCLGLHSPTASVSADLAPRAGRCTDLRQVVPWEAGPALQWVWNTPSPVAPSTDTWPQCRLRLRLLRRHGVGECDAADDGGELATRVSQARLEPIQQMSSVSVGPPLMMQMITTSTASTGRMPTDMFK